MGKINGPEPAPRRASQPERMLSALAVLAVGLLSVVVTLSVVTRWLGWGLIPDSVLLARELMVATIMLPLAVVTAGREHISVTVFTTKAGHRTRLVLEVIGHGVGLVFAGGLLLAGWRFLADAVVTGEYYDGDLYIPFWIGWAVFVFGAAAFFLRLAAMLVIDLQALVVHRGGKSS